MTVSTTSDKARSLWFEKARFGMFIHWGLYSNPAGVWQGKKNKHPYAEWLQASEPVSYTHLTLPTILRV